MKLLLLLALTTGAIAENAHSGEWRRSDDDNPPRPYEIVEAAEEEAE